MGLILDTGVLIASERRGESVKDVLSTFQKSHGEADIGISTVSAVELTHGIYRAKTEIQAARRRIFVEGALKYLIVYPFSLQIAQLAGKGRRRASRPRNQNRL